jgi:hypothetical protein
MSLPASLFEPEEPEETQPVVRVNPRTGEIETLGTVPKGAHFVTEPQPQRPERDPAADNPLLPRGVQNYLANLKGRGYSRGQAEAEIFRDDVWEKIRAAHPRISAVDVQQALGRFFPANDLFGGGLGDDFDEGASVAGAGGGAGPRGTGPARGAGPVIVQTPNGPFEFPDQAAADQFRRAAGIP